MKIYRYFILTTIFSLTSAFVTAQRNLPTHYMGVNMGGGFSNLFFGEQTTPQLGSGATLGLYYELEYNHFLFQTGIGINYSVNNNLIHVDKFSGGVQEYPTMEYHYSFENFVEENTYGVGFIPVKIGATFEHWYFLVGANIGLTSFANTSKTTTDVTIWASDEDVIDPLVGLPTHGLETFRVSSNRHSIDIEPFNAMLSAEIGIKLTSEPFAKHKKRMLDYQTSKKLDVKDRMRYRLSIFADYGLSNIHAYSANPAPYNGYSKGGLLVLNGVKDIEVHSILGYEPYKQNVLNNLFIGLKLSIQFNSPTRYSCNCDKYSE